MCFFNPFNHSSLRIRLKDVVYFHLKSWGCRVNVWGAWHVGGAHCPLGRTYGWGFWWLVGRLPNGVIDSDISIYIPLMPFFQEPYLLFSQLLLTSLPSHSSTSVLSWICMLDGAKKKWVSFQCPTHLGKWGTHSYSLISSYEGNQGQEGLSGLSAVPLWVRDDTGKVKLFPLPSSLFPT